jgi:hypothetical protein
MIGWQGIKNYKGYERNKPWPDLRHISGICLVGLKKKTETSGRYVTLYSNWMPPKKVRNVTD